MAARRYTNTDLFTVDTTGAGIGNATIAGNVTDIHGAGLASATVSALQSGVVRGQAATDGNGHYQLNLLPAGIYLLRAEKPNYLTGLRYGVNLSPNQTKNEHFALAGKPSTPSVTAVDRQQEALTLIPISTQLKVFSNGEFVFVRGGAKVAESRRFKIPVAGARKSVCLRDGQGVTWSFIR